MTAHKHAAMIKAKADNMELVVFRKYYDNSWGEIQRHDCCFMPDFEYFLCLPKHKEACLHWLGGGYTQSRYGASQDWDDYNPIKSWSCGSIFMQNHAEIRIKPRKEERWVAIKRKDKTEVYTVSFNSLDEAIDTLNGKYWQFIEIEVEV